MHNPTSANAPLFPIALRLAGRLCVVVGGGAVAVRRVEALREAEAAVLVVAPAVGETLAEYAAAGHITWRPEPYAVSCLEGAFLVVAATDNPAVNAQVAQDAQERGLLCNDAETPERGDCVIPSLVRRGALLLSVTTGGQSPALAARIRDELAAQYGEEYAAYTALLGEVRAQVLETVSDLARRRTILRALSADTSLLPLLRQGQTGEARKKAFSCILSSSD